MRLFSSWSRLTRISSSSRNDLFVILVELVAEERKLKTSLAGEGTVTLPPVTAPDTKQWNHVLPETCHLCICLAPKPLRRSG